MPSHKKLAAAVVGIGLSVALSVAAEAASLDKQLLLFGPEERAHQACVIRGLEQIARDKTLPGADRMKTGVLGDAVFTGGTHVATKGGAVRAKHRWYRLSFDCTVTSDQMKATAFTYAIGPEIPKEKWDEIGLWD